MKRAKTIGCSPGEVRELLEHQRRRISRLLVVHREELNDVGLRLVAHAVRARETDFRIVTSIADETAMSADVFVRHLTRKRQRKSALQ